MPSFFIETVGCQMNVLDSELVVAALLKEGFTQAESMKKADIILFNTCSIRQHAEDKIYSALGRLRLPKEAHPEKVIGVIGCMAQKDNSLIFKRAPFVDLVVGPGQIARIPELIAKVRAGQGPQMELSLERRGHKKQEVENSFDFYDPMRESSARHNPFMAYVRIMFGCDQFCTYCIVPYVRGPEQSRPMEEILAEVHQLVEQGCKEVTLIGQTVSKYCDPASGLRLSGLLEKCERIAETTPLERIRFVTSHPNSMSTDLFEAVRDLPHVMPYFHVPAQSGSNAQLKKMNRGYSVEKYRDVCREIMETVPGSAITSDFIVGFCDESEEDFQQTVQLVKDIRFKNSFIFKFSPREGTKAFELWEDNVPEEVKRRRNNELLAVQNQISTEESEKFIGQEVEILVEGMSKSANKLTILGQSEEAADGGEANTRGAADSNSIVQLTGRTPCDRIVVFDGPKSLIGEMKKVKITKANPFTLFGE